MFLGKTYREKQLEKKGREYDDDVDDLTKEIKRMTRTLKEVKSSLEKRLAYLLSEDCEYPYQEAKNRAEEIEKLLNAIQVPTDEEVPTYPVARGAS